MVDMETRIRIGRFSALRRSKMDDRAAIDHRAMFFSSKFRQIQEIRQFEEISTAGSPTTTALAITRTHAEADLWEGSCLAVSFLCFRHSMSLCPPN